MPKAPPPPPAPDTDAQPSRTDNGHDPGCVNPVDAGTHGASERHLYAASTGPTRPGSPQICGPAATRRRARAGSIDTHRPPLQNMYLARFLPWMLPIPIQGE